MDKEIKFLRHDFLFKVVVLGDTKAGKSCLVRKFVDDTFSEDYLPTIAVDFKTKILEQNGKTIKLQIWDSASSSRSKFAQMGELFYSGAMAAIYCFDITNKATFEHVEKWMAQLSNSQQQSGPKQDSILEVVVGCKFDLSGEQRKVSVEKGQELAIRHHARYVEVSAMTGHGIDDLFQSLTKSMVSRHRGWQTDSRLAGEQTRPTSTNNSFGSRQSSRVRRPISLPPLNYSKAIRASLKIRKKSAPTKTNKTVDEVQSSDPPSNSDAGKTAVSKSRGSDFKSCCVIS